MPWIETRPGIQWLFPPSVQDFVPAEHLSRFVVSLVRESLDLRAIYAAYKGEKGQPPFEPAMMVALLLYSYAVGLFVRVLRLAERAGLVWLGDLDSNQGCPGQSRKFYR